MPNDAKLGLVLGVGLVIAVAVVYYHKEPAQPPKTAGLVPAAAQEIVAGPPPSSSLRPKLSTQSFHTAGPREHRVQAGDTLFQLARHYYGDGDRFADLYRANRDRLATPETLEPGTVLVIPDLRSE